MSLSAHPVLTSTAMQFDLARQMICLRRAWPEHHLIWKMHDSPEVLAIATVRTRKIWQLQNLAIAEPGCARPEASTRPYLALHQAFAI
ncbi:MAG: hypothetical protein ACK5NE_00835 [Brachymonas sp.]